MNTTRIFKHLLTTRAHVARAFPASALTAIESAIAASESTHAGEIRFVVEGALDGTPLFKGQSPRARAIDLFSELRVWDTEHNIGLLIYVLLADRAVEIVADRGIHAKVGADAWQDVCRQIEIAFARSDYRGGVIDGVQRVTQHLVRHFPADLQGDELPNRPLVL